jgi:hypothetical protein
VIGAAGMSVTAAPVQTPPARSARKTGPPLFQATNVLPSYAATRGSAPPVAKMWLVNAPLALSAATMCPSRSQAT